MTRPAFSTKSLNKLNTVEPELAAVVHAAMIALPEVRQILGWSLKDFSVVWGYRSPEDQDALFAKGRSQLKGGQSPHNHTPSRAVDLIPYPWDWGNVSTADMKRFEELVQLMKIAARFEDYGLECGRDWKSFQDFPHFQRQGA